MKVNRPLTAIGLFAAALSFNGVAAVKKASDKAKEIARQTIIVDGHIDVPYRINDEWADVTKATEDGDFDYPRAKEGGLTAPFMSVYVPASLDNSPASTQLANQLIDSVEAITARAPDKFAIALSVDDVRSQFEKGLISLPMGMENGSPIQGEMTNLTHFYDRGIRYITLTHSQSNHISDSSYDLRRQWQGLSPFGKKLIPEMNKIGMLIDISHVSDAAFYQAVELSEAPVIASHSSLRAFTPDFERNMDDEMLKALAKNGGIIMINFGSGFVSKEAREWRAGLSQARNRYIKEHGDDNDKLEQFEKQYRVEHPYPYSSLSDVLDHIDHVAELIGVEHIGIGSDFDGVGDSLPVGLKDVSDYPNLVQGLLDRGYSEKQVKAILSENFLRVWSEVEAYAAKH